MGSLLSLSFALPLLFFLNLNVFAILVFEEGYTVSTVLDGNKLNLNPHSILPHFASSDLIILDSEHSAFFTVSSTASQETGVKWLSGKGFGFSDGDLAASMFNKPKNFAVDLNGNVYVADKGNLAIRKISKSGKMVSFIDMFTNMRLHGNWMCECLSGNCQQLCDFIGLDIEFDICVTTIAGGSKTPGHVDGPGRNASFSTDFELAFIPERCALMICDHGHKLVRQINLKSEDCARSSHPELSSSTWPWALAVGVACLVGLIMGFAVRPYITSNEGFNPLRFNATWKRYLINQGRQILMFCFDVRNAIVSVDVRNAIVSSLLYTLKRLTTLSLSQLSLVFSINSAEPQVSRRKSVTSLDSKRLARKESTKSRMVSEQLRDLISFDEVVDIPEESADNVFEQGAYNGNRNDVLCEGRQRVDNMICANILDFEMQGNGAPVEEPLVSSSGLVKRR